jgi:hypothetical protein
MGFQMDDSIGKPNKYHSSNKSRHGWLLAELVTPSFFIARNAQVLASYYGFIPWIIS